MAQYQRAVGDITIDLTVPHGVDQMTELQREVWLAAMRAADDLVAAFLEPPVERLTPNQKEHK